MVEERLFASFTVKPNTSKRTGGPATASPVGAPSATGVTIVVESRRRPGFERTYTNKAYDPLIKEQMIQMGLNGSGVRDTARVLKVNRNTESSQFKKVSTSFKSSPLILTRA